MEESSVTSQNFVGRVGCIGDFLSEIADASSVLDVLGIFN